MTRTPIVKGVAVGFAGVAASLALAAPASARFDPGPGYHPAAADAAPAAADIQGSGLTEESSWEIVQVATGALAGLGAATAGFAAFELSRRRRHHGPAVS